MNSPTTAAGHSQPRGRRRLLIAVASLTALGAAGWFGWTAYFAKPDELAGYQLASVTRADIEEVVTATGTLQPRDYVDVGAQVSGQLTKIHVEVGSRVEENDLLAEIDRRVLQSRVDASRAQLRSLRAQLTERESNLVLAETQHRRQRNLMAEDATTAEALQNAEATLRATRAQIAVLKAQIDQAESNLRADEANLEYTRIYAPMAGTVVSINARQGQTLNTNQQAPVILRIADLSTMTVETQVSEADVGKLRLGMEAYFHTLGNQNGRWSGTLRKIEPTPIVTNNVVLYNALFDVPNPDGKLMTQMTAQVFFVVASARDVLSVPMSALSMRERQGGSAERGRSRVSSASVAAPTDDGATRTGRGASEDETASPGLAERRPRPATVRAVGPDGRLEERRVMVGVTNRVQAEILDGLGEGTQVVTGLRAGDSARRTNTQPLGMPRIPGR